MSARSWAAIALALASPPALAQQEDALPCKPGVIRPRPTAIPAKVPSKDVLEREREIAALRAVVEKYRERVDDAVRTAYRREREAVRRRFLARINPAEETERARRLDAIASFRAFLAKRSGNAGGVDRDKLESEATFRLAELLFEEATDRHLVASRVWNAENAKHREAPESGEPRPDYREAVAAYRSLVHGPRPKAEALVGRMGAKPLETMTPTFNRRDAALYMIAYCLGEQGDAKASRDAFAELASLADTSYRAEAWLRVGEYHFERAEHDAAIDAYRQSAELGDGPFFDKALYKLAWSYYRRGEKGHANAWAESANAFAELVEVAPDSPLRAEALQYLAIIYADHGGLPAVKAAVAGKPWGDDVIEALASVWYEQANWDDAASTYELALAARPEDDDAPLWANRRVLALERLGREEDVARAREALHARYGSGSVWQAQKAGSQSVVLAADAVAGTALLQAAMWRHQRAQWTRLETDYDHAARLYGEYLQRYPGRPDAYDLAFYRAECLYFAGKLDAAADAYGTVLEFTTEGPWHAEAAFSRFKARESIVGLAAVEAPAADGAARLPIPETMRGVVNAAEDFTCTSPTDWRVPEALFRAAQVYAAHGRRAAARERAEAVIGAAPKEDFSAYATTLVVDSWRAEGRYDRAEEDAIRFAALAPGRTPAIVKATREALLRVAAEAAFQVAASLAEKGDHTGAAAKYLAVAEAAPKAGVGTLAAKALFAAGESLEKTGRSAQAAKAFAEVVTKHRNDALAEAAAFRRAHNLARVLEVETAARAYSSFVLDFPFSADVAAAAWNAALLWEAAGRPAEAAAAYERFADSGARTPAERAAAWVAAGDAWLTAGKLPAAQRDFELVASSGDAPDAVRVVALAGLARATRLANKKGETGETDAVHAVDLQMDLVRNGTSTPESARAAAEAALAAAESLYRGFEALPIPAKKDPEPAIRAKHQQLLRAREAYLAIAALGDPDATTQALHRIGEGYAALASAVRAVSETAQARGETAAPLEEKAVAALARNVELAAQARVSTEWTAKSHRLLARLAPASFTAPREDAVDSPDHDAWAIPPMLAPGSLLASADPTGSAAPPLARTLAAAVERFDSARRDGDLAALQALEAELATTVVGLPADARDAAIAWHDLGVVRDALADLSGAANAFHEALARSPTLGAAAAGRSAALARGKDPAQAISFARDWLKQHPADADVRVNLAGALRRRGDAPAAVAMAIEALAADARNGRARRAAVAAAIAAKRPSLALFAARQGLALSSEDPESWLTLGLVLRSTARSRVGRDTGRAVLSQGATLPPRSARLAHAAGAAKLADGDVAEALVLLERAAKTSIDPRTWVALAATRRAAKDPAGAEGAATHALSLEKDHPAAIRALGVARWDAGNLRGAEETFERYLGVTGEDRGAADPVRGWLWEIRERQKTAPAPKKETP